MFAWILGHFGRKWRFYGQNMGMGGAMLTLNELILTLGVVMAKIDQEIRP